MQIDHGALFAPYLPGVTNKQAVIASNKRRAIAVIPGETTYLSDKPCRNGHTGPRYVSTRGCVQCSKEQHIAWRKNNKERERQLHQDGWRKFQYGLSKADFEALWAKQKGLCAICDDPLPKSPHIDHDHETERVRGLTCGPCNRGLGFFKDSLLRLRKAAAYLERNSCRTF